MANENNTNKDSNNRLKKIIDLFRASTKLTTEGLYGTSEKHHDDTAADLAGIKNIINDITNKYKKNTGPDVLEFYNAVMLNDNNRRSKLNKRLNKNKQLMDISGLFNNPDSYNINEIFSQESGRFQMYNSYRLIYENIPQMTQALTTYVDNILSPDDFTKNVFNIYVSDEISTNIKNTDKNSDVVDNCNELMRIYKLENFAKRVITDTLKIGDQFVAVLNMNDEMERLMLSEDGTLTAGDINNKKDEMILPNDIELSESEILELSEMFFDKPLKEVPVKPDRTIIKNGKTIVTENYSSVLKEYEEKKKIFDEESIRMKASIADCINNNIIITEDSSCLLESNFEIAREYSTANSDKMITSFQQNSDKIKDRTETLFLKSYKHGRRKKDEKLRITGSVLKILKPERVVKLSLDDFEYGYYYIENLENSPDYLTTGTYSINSNIFNNFKQQEFDQPDMINAKYRLITDIFVRNISKKINKKLINDNPEFKDTIYNLLKQNYILNKQIRIVYLGPKDVVHFGVGSEEYKDSLYKPILFSAKLYLAVLTSQVMLRLVRSPEKRAFYIEVDLDNDTESVVQSFIRDTKTKDIKMSNFGQDINTLLNNIGTFQDYYIPVVNGNKPLEIDTIPGMNVEITNDFLEYLLKTMISGIGIPPEYLSYTENTEFARSLGMMNGKFVRSIIVYQKEFGEKFTEMFRLLYKNEYMNEFTIAEKEKLIKKHLKDKSQDEDDDTVNIDTETERNDSREQQIDNKIKLFDLNLLEIKFPSPQALNMTTMLEQVNSSKEIIEFISNTLIGENDSDQNSQGLKSAFKSLLIQNMLTNFNWTEYNKLLEKAKIENKEEKLAAGNNTSDMSSGTF